MYVSSGTHNPEAKMKIPPPSIRPPMRSRTILPMASQTGFGAMRRLSCATCSAPISFSGCSGRHTITGSPRSGSTGSTPAERLASLTLDEEALPGGRYFSKGAPIASSEDAYDEDFQCDLWVSIARMAGLPVEIETSYERHTI